MTMRENNGRYVLLVLLEDFEVGNADIDAVDTLFGKAHSGIEHQHLVAVAQQRTVHPELADAAEGNDFEDVRHLRLLARLSGREASVYHAIVRIGAGVKC